ncbi:hypothetical protein D046_3557B, partial [Vibrio parahaemolyticus V-223/04]
VFQATKQQCLLGVCPR